MLCEICRAAHEPVDLGSKSKKQACMALFELNLIFGQIPLGW